MRERDTRTIEEKLFFSLPDGKKLKLSSPQQVLFLQSLPQYSSLAIERDELGKMLFPKEVSRFRNQERISNLRRSINEGLVAAGLQEICSIKKQNGRIGYYLSNTEKAAVVVLPIKPIRGNTNGHVIFEAPSINGHHAKAEEIFTPQKSEHTDSEQSEEPDSLELKELEKELPNLLLGDQSPVLIDLHPEPLEDAGTDSLTLHFQDIRQFPLLSADEEKEFGIQIFLAKLALRNLRNILDLLSSEQRSHAEKMFIDKRAQRLLNALDKELKQKLKVIRKKEASDEDANSERLFLADVSANDKMVQEKKQQMLTTEDEKVESQALNEFSQQQLKFAEQGLEALDSLINSNLRMAIYWSKKYQGRGLELLSLNSFAIEGLITAVDRFDYRKGYKFSTFAAWWIRQAIMRGLGDFGSAIRLPMHIYGKLNHFFTRQVALTQESGKEISLEDVIRQEASDPDRITLLRALETRKINSLDRPLGDEQGSSMFGDLVPDPENLEETAINNTLRIDLRREIDKILTPRESRIIALRFGLNGNGKTLEEIGKEFGVTRERIRQIEAKALRKLKSSPDIQHLFREVVTESRLPRHSNIIFPPGLST